ncbi:MAG: heavy-metal-associated domain-containing protein [Chloroflexi bacterium]|nr:heavy-metal-associated domain-containing protein [Chloroflexota bacterium]
MDTPATHQIVFQVPSLAEQADPEDTCCTPSPAEAITHGLRRIPGVRRIEVDACCQRVGVEYDPAKTGPAALAQVLEHLGYLGGGTRD